MIKTLRNLLKQDKERFVVPRGVQDVIPIKAIYDDGIFQVGRDKFSKTYKFSDINYAVASREDKEAMFLEYSELLNSLDSGATTKITINNRRLNRANFEKTILLPLKGDALDEYREEYNRMLLDKATGANAIIQEKYITISVCKKNVEEARNYFARVGADLIAHFGRLGSKCVELEPDERLRIFTTFTVPVKKRSSASTSKKPAERVTTSRISSALIRWSSRATISRSESVTAECCSCGSTLPISRTVWLPK